MIPMEFEYKLADLKLGISCSLEICGELGEVDRNFGKTRSI